MIRGKRKHLCDLSAKVHWLLLSTTTTTTTTEKEVVLASGVVVVEDITADKEFDVTEISVDNNNNNINKSLVDELVRKQFVGKLQQQLQLFCDLLKEK